MRREEFHFRVTALETNPFRVYGIPVLFISRVHLQGTYLWSVQPTSFGLYRGISPSPDVHECAVRDESGTTGLERLILNIL